MFLEYNYIFECDDKIAPYIMKLNNKGYITDFCCEGHDRVATVIINPDTGETHYCTEKEYVGAYISFSRPTSMDITVMNLGKPKNWSCEKVYDNEYDNILHYIIRRHFTEEEKEKPINDLVDKSMKELGEWIETLPEIKLPFRTLSNNMILRVYKGE